MSNQKIRRYISILCVIGCFVSLGLFINEKYYQPYRLKLFNEHTKELYNKPSDAPSNTYPTLPPSDNKPTTPDNLRDKQGRLIYFKDLLANNPDTKGWITFPNTNIDYVVMQNDKDPLFYLRRNFKGDYHKAGCLFIDENSTVENNPKNIVIHGHNMHSTNNMFHYLEFMKKLDYLKSHTTFDFDTIYQTGQWKIISVFLTNGSNKDEPFFDYTKTIFNDSSEFLNYVYQLKIRSIYNIDSVDINEDDELVTLSTCTYEIPNYRLVIVARKLRPGEDPSVNTDKITENNEAVYPNSYFVHFKKQAPKLPTTFEEALAQGKINWFLK